MAIGGGGFFPPRYGADEKNKVSLVGTLGGAIYPPCFLIHGVVMQGGGAYDNGGGVCHLATPPHVIGDHALGSCSAHGLVNEQSSNCSQWVKTTKHLTIL